MSRVVIVADDLTGAADSAAAYGPFTEVAVVLDASAGLPAAEVVAIDTDSRHRSPEFAAQAVRSAVRAAARGGRTLYKKIDSTLRGHVATEVIAALDELGPSAGALLAPSFPATGRTVTGGVLHVGSEPHRNGELRALFTGSGVGTALVPLEVVRSGPKAVVHAYDTHRAAGVRVVCADAETDEDLRVLDAALAQLGPHVLPVGSAGLTRAAVGVGSTPRRDDEQPPDGQVLTVLGSYSALGREQRAVLAASPEVTAVEIAAPFGLAQQRNAAAALSAAGGDLLLIPDPDAPVHRSHAGEVAAALSEVTAGHLRAHASPRGLILAGGETARAVLLSAGAKGFTVLGELEPGVVRSRVPALGGLALITKAGAFGEPSTVEQARRSLHENTFTAAR
ncbi:four-carbon acid sugar kinase family protein [Amycolatopsis sp. NPDC051903]|uniref:four-carbon acid sugar kinase family protein n=1 Tax=Amycolatopsis sp. NPDC051903 TaxID=3363936 RepID=UPI0037A3BC10